MNTEYLYSLLETMMTSYPAVMLVLAVLIADIKCVSPVSLMIHPQWVLMLNLMTEMDYKRCILHLSVAFWLFITVHSLEIMLIWYDI